MIEKFSKSQKRYVLLGYVIIYIILPVLVVRLVPLGSNISRELASTLLVFASAVGVLVVLLLTVKNVLLDDLRIVKDNKRLLLKSLKGLGIIYLLNIIFGLLYTYFDIYGVSENQESVQELVTANPWVILLPMALFVPIIEEVVFRGVIFDFIESKIGIVFAVVISSLLFGLLHVLSLDSLVFLPQYVMMGLVLAYTYVKSDKNLIVTIALHILLNTAAVFLIAVSM